MASISITNFGGEQPSVSPRALPAGAAQTNQNLNLASAEFVPQLQDTTTAAAVAGAKTLYRFNSGWRSSAVVQSYVKGQLNAENTERTYYTTDDGSSAPVVIDNLGASRTVGVYRPAKPAVATTVGSEFTNEEANTFLYTTAADAIHTALKAAFVVPAEPTARYSGTTIYGGPYSKNGLFYASESGNTNHWDLHAGVSTGGMVHSVLNSSVFRSIVGATAYYPITALPYTVVLTSAAETTLTTALRAIQFPADAGDKAGAQVLTDANISAMVAELKDYFNVTKWGKESRDLLEATAKEYYSLLVSAAPTWLTGPDKNSATYKYQDVSTAGSPFRTIDEKPAGPQYETVGETSVYSQAWKNYDAAVAKYNDAVAAFAPEPDKFIARVQELRSTAETTTKQIEAEVARRLETLTRDTALITDFLMRKGGVQALYGSTVERIVETRYYAVTFVTDWGEESAPSEPSDGVEVDQNDTVTITRPNSTAVGSALAGANITKWRIYRTNSGASSTNFQFVEELLTSSTSYADTKKGDALGEVCPTITWEPPPYRADMQQTAYPRVALGANPYLRGLVGMPNGVMAGFFDNLVCFSEPYIPYAWPVEYQISLEFPVVGLGVFGQTLFVGTTEQPYFISGADSASMSAQKIDSPQACSSARSIAAVSGGVMYASPDGLCLASPNGVQVVTKSLFTREDWQKLSPATMFAAVHEDIYYLWYTGNGGGCYTFDFASRKLGRIVLPATAAFADKSTDTLYVVSGTSVNAVFGSAARRTGKWKSGAMTMPMQQPLGWLKVYGAQSAGAPVTVRWYADGVLRHTATITSTEPVRLPAGRWLEHEIEVESTARIQRVVLAGNTQELQQV